VIVLIRILIRVAFLNLLRSNLPYIVAFRFKIGVLLSTFSTYSYDCREACILIRFAFLELFRTCRFSIVGLVNCTHMSIEFASKFVFSFGLRLIDCVLQFLLCKRSRITILIRFAFLDRFTLFAVREFVFSFGLRFSIC